MSEQVSKAEIFDVFLCHNSEDKPAVREIARKLVQCGIKAWLDIEQIRPGTTWQTALGEQIKNIKSAAVFVGNSGIGPWQSEEIKAFLGEFMDRKCPVIPTILACANGLPELPWTLKNRHRVDFRVSDPDPLKQLIWGITGHKPAAGEPLVPRKEEKGASRTFSQARLYPPLLQPPDPEQATQLEILRSRVEEYWVDGVLRHSLHNEVLISLGKQQMDQAVNAPWKYTVEVSDAVNSAPQEDRDISAIYDTTGLLLILGEPGSGKTTTLLDLARTLLDRARDDIKERVPIVLNLSSWKKKQPLAEWMSSELSEKYRIPRKIARSWIQHDYLLPLLDGLDEVKITLQPDCVAAINAFIEQFNPSGLVICCRLNEYRWLPERLKLNGAICLEPLSSEEVSKYLASGGSKLAALREAVNSDPVLQELAQTPLMLSIMSLACQEVSGNELARQKGDSLEERRRQIFGLYVEQMFQRKGTTPLGFPKEKVIGWLSWLARKMREHSQSVFLVEGLQPSWLGTRAQRVAYGTVLALSLAPIFGLIFGLIGGPIGGLIFGLIVPVGVGLGCWSKSPLQNGVASGSIAGLIFGLILGLSGELRSGLSDKLIGGLLFTLTFGVIGGLGIGSLNHVTLVETIDWKWNQFWKGTIPGSVFGLILGLSGGLISSGALRIELSWLINSLIFGLTGGLVSGLIGGVTGRAKAGKVSPNQGIKLSRKNSLAVFVVTWLIFGPIFGLIGVIGGLGSGRGLIFGLIVGLLFGLIFALIGGLNRGGSAVMKHYVLRLILWLRGSTPFNSVEFLDHCAKLILLKKVGGGYIFIHRMLLAYFAELTPEKRSDETAKITQPA